MLIFKSKFILGPTCFILAVNVCNRGYYCGLVDPNQNYVEFSYGQPLGPGTEEIEKIMETKP